MRSRVPPPWNVGDGQPQDITLDGGLMPWKDGPVFLSMPGTTASYLAVFSTREKLEAFMKRAGIGFTSVKRVDNGAQLVASVPEIEVIKDPWYTLRGTVRFQQVQR